MKFGIVTDPVNALSLRVALSRTLPADPAHERVKVHKFQDGSVALFDFGVREQLTASFPVELLTKADFVTLADYLSANEGARVKVVEEWENERLFGPGVPTGSTGPSTYYVRILEHGQYSEAEWSATRGLFSTNIKVLFAGVAADGSDEKAPAGSALLNALVRVDTVCADYIQAGDPGAAAVGSRWLRTGDRALLRRVSGGWGFLYTVAADDPAYGLKNGVFYWSAFCDEPTDLAAGVAEDHLAGWITAGSIDFGQENIDIGKGPAIARKEGFSFSVSNSARFHDYLEQNRINFSGARAYLSILRDTIGTRFVQQMRAGRVNTGKISLTSYTVECEPEVLDGAGIFPVSVISLDDPRYADVMAAAVGKPVFVTFGEFGKAQLQNVSSDRSTMTVARTNDAETASISMAIDRSYPPGGGKHLRLLVNKSLLDSYRYTFTAEQIASINLGRWAVQVQRDSYADSDNEGEIRRVLSIAQDVANYWSLYLDEEFPTLPPSGGASPPDTNERIDAGIIMMLYQFQIGEEVSGGFGTYDNGAWTDHYRLWTLDENQKHLIELPVSDFTMNADKNMITLAPNIAADGGKVTTFAEIKGVNWAPLADGFSFIPGLYTERVAVDFRESDFPLSAWYDKTDLDGKYWEEIYFIIPNSEYTVEYSRYSYTAKQLTPYTPYRMWDQSIDPLTISARNISGKFKHSSAEILFDVNRDNSLIIAWQYQVNHSQDVLLANATDLRLCVSFDIISYWLRSQAPILSGGYYSIPDQTLDRWFPVGFTLRLRARRRDGSYIYNDDWKKSVTADQIGAGWDYRYGPKRRWNVKIDNMPGTSAGSDSGFTSTPAALDDIFPTWHASYECASYADLPNAAAQQEGDLAWVIGEGQLYSSNGTTWTLASNQPLAGDIVWKYYKIKTWSFLFEAYVYRTINTIGKVVTDITVIPGLKKLVVAVPDTDYIPSQTMSGRDLFNLSSLLTPANVWADIDAFEFTFSPVGIEDGQWWDKEDNLAGVMHYYFDLKDSAPRLFSSSIISVVDKPLFSDVRGEFLSGSYPTPAEDVSRAIMDACYPGAYSAPALNDLFALTTRKDWLFRKQFTAQKKSDAVLEELLKNLWAVATISDDDLLEIQSLAPDDHGRVSLVLTDSNILEDSPGEIEQREADSMFQRFEMSFDYYPPSAASAALQKWNRVQIASPTDGTNDEKTALTRSAAIWNRDVENVKRDEFEYHYASGPLPLNTWAVKWHSLNSWLVEVAVPIDHALGSDGLRLMSRVLIRSYYLSASLDLDAFVVRRRPDIYSATCRIGLYIWAPPGYLGGFLDYYNDALNIETRDITLWTDANGKRNDAGQIETRGTPAEKDAGQIETRTF